MKLSLRLQTLCSEIRACKIFADVGCDHGYCAEFVLWQGLCERCYISDISAASLAKAEKLLSAYIEAGTVKSFCCAGLELVPKDAEQVLIGGMGGEEIIGILKDGFLPQRLVLQPMKNSSKLREYLLINGYALTRDYTFFDGKFYDVICAQKGGAVRKYDERTLLFGYDNLNSPTKDFVMFLQAEIGKCREQLSAAGKEIPAVKNRCVLLTEILHEAERNL